MGPEDDIHIRIAVFDLLRHLGLLRHTAADANDHIRVGPLIVGGLPHIAKDPHLCMLPDGTGIEDQKIRSGLVVGQAKAHVREHAADQLRIRLVLLAAEGDGAGQGLTGHFRMIKPAHPAGIVLLLQQRFVRNHAILLAHSASE